MGWAALLAGFFKSTQALRDIYAQSVVLFYSVENQNDQNQTNEIQEEREAIIAAYKQPGLTDANRNALRKRIITLSRM